MPLIVYLLRAVVSFNLLALDCSNAGEHLALDSLEHSTTTSRNIAYLVGKTELVDSSNRVATTYE